MALRSLPEQIPTHWNIRGEIDGYGGKWTLFIFPVMMVAMLALFYFLPALSPKQFEVNIFAPLICTSWCSASGLFAYMDGVMLYVVHQAVAKAATIDLGRAFIAGMFLFFALHGQRHGQGAQELLHRGPRALDSGQRSRLERYARVGGLGIWSRRA